MVNLYESISYNTDLFILQFSFSMYISLEFKTVYFILFKVQLYNPAGAGKHFLIGVKHIEY